MWICVIAICFPTLNQVVSQSPVYFLCHDFIRAVKEENKDCASDFLTRPMMQIKLSYFALNVHTAASNQGTDLGQDDLLKIC